MELAGLEVLKKKLVEAKDFASIWDFFMTHFGENPEFMALGEPVRSPLLGRAIAEAARAVFGNEVPVSSPMLIRLKEQRFIHGGVQLQGRFANVFYFEEIGVGLLAVALSAAGDNRMVRFTARTGPGGELARQ